VILPGVGHFGQMMRAIDALGVREALGVMIRSGKPFLGICLGLQALFESSAEADEVRGLGILPGTVHRFPLDARVPHMGWNDLQLVKPSRLVEGKPYVYFAHSYYCPLVGGTSATCEYSGIAYTAVLEADNVCGVQFHPEKSGPAGIDIVRRFIEC
jgi:imidazole glycerol phosphate synthase glutamine amidotransferase subunit